MVGTIALAIAMTDHSKTESLDTKLQNVGYSNVVDIPLFSIQAPLYTKKL